MEVVLSAKTDAQTIDIDIIHIFKFDIPNPMGSNVATRLQDIEAGSH